MTLEPKTLQDAILFFATPANCREYVVARRWPNGVTCPTCGSEKVKFSEKHNRWQCAAHHAKRQFTLKTGTIFEDSPLTMDKWLLVTWMLGNCKNGVSSYEIHRNIGVTQKTAWFMLQRIRKIMQDDLTGGTLGGEIEVDESFIGGKVRNMHKDRKARMQRNDRMGSKTIVLGILQRGKKVRATVIPDRKADTIQAEITGIVDRGATVYSDEFGDKWRMDKEYVHETVNHLHQYVNGQVHTNGIENFWSLLKRGLSGTYVSVEPFHLFRYVDEQAWRYNNRKDELGKPLTDSDRFSNLVTQILGKRLTFAEATGKTAPAHI